MSLVRLLSTHVTNNLVNISLNILGWTILDNVILASGTLFLISDTPNDGKLPDLKLIMSHWKRPRGKDKDKPLYSSPEEPTPKDIQVISSNAVHAMFGQSASKIQGVTWMCNHPSECMSCTMSSIPLWLTMPPSSRRRLHVLFPLSHL